jgi:hypothetical protein
VRFESSNPSTPTNLKNALSDFSDNAFSFFDTESSFIAAKESPVSVNGTGDLHL